MKGKRDTGIPEFQSLEEEREYWEARGPLGEGHGGRINKPGPKQKRSSFLAVRLTGEELTRLRDIAAKQGLGPSTFARIFLTSVVDQEDRTSRRITLDEAMNALEKNLPQSVKEDAERILETISKASIGNPPFLIEISKLPKAEELERLSLQFISSVLAMTGIEVVYKVSKQKELTSEAEKAEKVQ